MTLVVNRVSGLGSGQHTPTRFFWKYPPPGLKVSSVFYDLNNLVSRAHVKQLVTITSNYRAKSL